MVPTTPAPKNFFKLKSSCAKGAEKNDASNRGRGRGGEGAPGGGVPPMVVSHSNTSLGDPLSRTPLCTGVVRHTAARQTTIKVWYTPSPS